jgi:hypothetical protein
MNCTMNVRKVSASLTSVCVRSWLCDYRPLAPGMPHLGIKGLIDATIHVNRIHYDLIEPFGWSIFS